MSNPPAAVELEAVVIGTLLIEPHQLVEVLPMVAPDTFFDHRHQTIYNTMVDMWRNGKTVDLFTLVQELKNTDQLKQIGGAEFLTQLTQQVGSASHLIQHVQIVLQYAYARKYIEAGLRTVTAASDSTKDIQEVIEECNRIFDQANQYTVGRSDSVSMQQSVAVALREAEQRQQKFLKGETIGVPTGLAELDQLTCGWQPGNLIVLAARPSMGKTSVAVKFAKSAAESGVPTCIYSLEMGHQRLTGKLLMSECEHLFPRAYAKGDIKEHWPELEQAGKNISRLPIYINDNAKTSMESIRAHAKMMHSRGKCGLIVVDYLQLTDGGGERSQNREQEIAKASRLAKQTAEELGVPFILLSQLSRETERRIDKRPQLADLRESGAIEQDADVVIFVYRPWYYKIPLVEDRSGRQFDTKGMGLLVVAKNRDGELRDLFFAHNAAMNRIEDFQSFNPLQALPEDPDHLPF